MKLIIATAVLFFGIQSWADNVTPYLKQTIIEVSCKVAAGEASTVTVYTGTSSLFSDGTKTYSIPISLCLELAKQTQSMVECGVPAKVDLYTEPAGEDQERVIKFENVKFRFGLC